VQIQCGLLTVVIKGKLGSVFGLAVIKSMPLCCVAGSNQVKKTYERVYIKFWKS